MSHPWKRRKFCSNKLLIGQGKCSTRNLHNWWLIGNIMSHFCLERVFSHQWHRRSDTYYSCSRDDVASFEDNDSYQEKVIESLFQSSFYQMRVSLGSILFQEPCIVVTLKSNKAAHTKVSCQPFSSSRIAVNLAWIEFIRCVLVIFSLTLYFHGVVLI